MRKTLKIILYHKVKFKIKTKENLVIIKVKLFLLNIYKVI